MKHQWSNLSHLQIGQYCEYYTKMQLVLLGFDVYSAEVDDRGIDLVVRKEPGWYWDIQVKSVRNLNYVFMRKAVFRLRPNLILALNLLRDGEAPDQFLIPASCWLKPDDLFVDRDYTDKASSPEYGLRLTEQRLDRLQPYTFEGSAEKIFSEDPSRV